jgi:hypothetical protein
MVRFADDTVIIAQGEIDLKGALESLDDILKCNWKMEIKWKETEVMVCCKDFENINITMDDRTLKQVPKFKYLGSTGCLQMNGAVSTVNKKFISHLTRAKLHRQQRQLSQFLMC